MVRRRTMLGALTLVVLGVAVAAALFFSGALTAQATQNPHISLDMVTTGNSYDATTNTMTVGPIDSCSSSPAPGDNTTHSLPVDVVIQNVEDLIGWQIRLNYDGGKMRPIGANFTPFTDSTTGQNISFANLPIDSASALHRDVIGASDIPAAAAGPQTALIGSIYIGAPTAAVSPDTPPKTIPDDSSYHAPSGGVLATLTLQVRAGNAGRLLSMDLGSSPDPPSAAVIFTGSGIAGQREIFLGPSALGSGFHGEGVPCPAATPTPGPSAAPVDTVADRVFGQGGSFTSKTCNTAGFDTPSSASSLCFPEGVAVDAAGHLYVADSGNSRVLEYDSPSTSRVANRVFGQGGSFTTGACNRGLANPPSASSLCFPVGVAVDAAGNLYVADEGNQRVLEYNTPLTTDTVADRVFGQGGSFTSATCIGFDSPSSASGLCNPVGVAVDAAGNLYVADDSNNRVLEYNTPLTTDTVADRVFGQGGSFTSNTCNLALPASASSLCNPFGVAVDAAGNLYVADLGNNRVLEYNTPLTTDTVADRVFGQEGSFGGDHCLGFVPAASSLCSPLGVAVDAAGNLYVADDGNNRALEYNTPLTTDTVADRVFGQGGSFTTGTCNQGLANPSASSLCGPSGVAVDAAGHLYVADSSNSRVLEYNQDDHQNNCGHQGADAGSNPPSCSDPGDQG